MKGIGSIDKVLASFTNIKSLHLDLSCISFNSDWEIIDLFKSLKETS